MRVEQFLKLRDADLDDMLEVYCILNDVTDDQRNILLTKSFKHLSKLCAKIDLSGMNVTGKSKPFFIRLGRWLYRVPSDFTDLPYGKYIEISDIVSDIHENHKGEIEDYTLLKIPEVVSIVFGVPIETVMKADASKVYPVGAFFLNNILSFSRLKQELKAQNLIKTQSRQESSNSTSTNDTTKS